MYILSAKLIKHISSAWLDAQHFVADLHEGEQVHFIRDVALLGLRKVVLTVCQGFQSYYTSCYISLTVIKNVYNHQLNDNI